LTLGWPGFRTRCTIRLCRALGALMLRRWLRLTLGWPGFRTRCTIRHCRALGALMLRRWLRLTLGWPSFRARRSALRLDIVLALRSSEGLVLRPSWALVLGGGVVIRSSGAGRVGRAAGGRVVGSRPAGLYDAFALEFSRFRSRDDVRAPMVDRRELRSIGAGFVLLARLIRCGPHVPLACR